MGRLAQTLGLIGVNFTNGGRMKLFALAFFTIAVLTGCSTPPLIAMPRSGDERVRTEFFEPRVGVTAKREVGESLLRRGVTTTTRKSTVTILDEASSSMDLGHKLHAAAGTTGVLQRRADSGLPMMCLNTSGAGTLATGTAIGCLVDTRQTGSFDQSMFAARDRYFPLAGPVRYKLNTTQQVVEDPADFHVDVLYQGLSKGEVKISFREFQGGLARPAFTQDVAYETESDGTAILAFKGMRIKVLKATRQDITYVVEQPPTN